MPNSNAVALFSTTNKPKLQSKMQTLILLLLALSILSCAYSYVLISPCLSKYVIRSLILRSNKNDNSQGNNERNNKKAPSNHQKHQLLSEKLDNRKRDIDANMLFLKSFYFGDADINTTAPAILALNDVLSNRTINEQIHYHRFMAQGNTLINRKDRINDKKIFIVEDNLPTQNNSTMLLESLSKNMPQWIASGGQINQAEITLFIKILSNAIAKVVVGTLSFIVKLVLAVVIFKMTFQLKRRLLQRM